MIRRIFRAISAPARAIARHLLKDDLAKLGKRIVLQNAPALERVYEKQCWIESKIHELDELSSAFEELSETVVTIATYQHYVEEFHKLESKVEDLEMPEIDYSELEIDYSSLANEIDYHDFSGWIDYSELARELDDEDIALAMDTDAIASSISEKITVSISIAE